MKLIVCLDDKDGMLFNKRRLSSDRLLCKRICEIADGHVLRMNTYSASLFAGMNGNFCVDDAFVDRAGPEDYCFVENLDVTPYMDSAREVIIFRWNRVYPADLRFPFHRLNGWTLIERTEFAGKSHSRITQEVFRQ